MSATKLDGTLYRDEIFADLAERVAALKDKGITPGLATVLVGEDPGSQSYVKMKHRDCEKLGINSIRKDLPADISQEELEAVIDELNADDACTGYIVQLPLPMHLDENAILERIDPEKDADGLHPVNLGKLVLNEEAPLPCTPNGCLHLLRRFGVELNGAKTVVIGRGVTVGRPIGLMLTRRSENSTVTLCHTGTKDLAAETRNADIVIAAAGQPHMLTADIIKEGAALLDVGVSRVDGKLTGDIAPDCWDKAGYVSPNPGGVGPLTRAFWYATSLSARKSWREFRQSPRRALGTVPAACFRAVGGHRALHRRGGLVRRLCHFQYWRRATFLLRLALLWLTVVRLTCDSSRVGVLAVRSRRFDATFTGVIGALMAFLAYSVDALGS